MCPEGCLRSFWHLATASECTVRAQICITRFSKGRILDDDTDDTIEGSLLDQLEKQDLISKVGTLQQWS